MCNSMFMNNAINKNMSDDEWEKIKDEAKSRNLSEKPFVYKPSED